MRCPARQGFPVDEGTDPRTASIRWQPVSVPGVATITESVKPVMATGACQPLVPQVGPGGKAMQ
jgi:hypothetical protein